MAQKQTAIFECQTCATTYPKWQGRCDSCLDWNTLIECQKTKKNGLKTNSPVTLAEPLHTIEPEAVFYYPTDISEFDAVLGKGLVKGSAVLLGGEPGVGKSTVSLQVCLDCAKKGLTVLYVSAEESKAQLKLRAARLGGIADRLFVLTENNMLAILAECERLKPDIILLDSIQVVQTPGLTALEGTISQVRQCASLLIQWVKQTHTSAIIIGHITKDGHIAGPKVLEHLVDVILYLEGDRHHCYRLLRCHKNRYGSTDTIGLFEMNETGLRPIPDAAKAFIEDNAVSNPGSVIVPYNEGSRILLIEIQALVVETGYGMAKRNFVGVNPNRANVLIAALDKVFKLKLSSYDIFITVIGGLTVGDPCIDLAMIVALISSLRQKKVKPGWAVCGEVGLTGEIRAVSYLDKRLAELRKNGFEACIIPKKNTLPPTLNTSFNCIGVASLVEAMQQVFVQHD